MAAAFLGSRRLAPACAWSHCQRILRVHINCITGVLTGSERQRQSGATGDRLKEASGINVSLTVLGQVIMSLVDVQHGRRQHVPYRNSRLTFLLQVLLQSCCEWCLMDGLVLQHLACLTRAKSALICWWCSQIPGSMFMFMFMHCS